jgi:CheY-like chemotaxis protein
LFEVTLGLAESAPEPSAFPPADGAGASPRMLKVVVADDNPVDRRHLEELLLRAGHEVTAVPSGEAALEVLEQHSEMEILFVDLSMAGRDGFETARAVRRREIGSERGTAIVAVTSHNDSSLHQLCLEAGMDDVLSKPVNPAALAETLRCVLHRTPPFSPGAPFDEHQAMARLLGDQAMLRTLSQLFVAEAPARLERIQSAATAGDWPAGLGEIQDLRSTATLLELDPGQALLEQMKAACLAEDVVALRDGGRAFEAELARLAAWLKACPESAPRATAPKEEASGEE